MIVGLLRSPQNNTTAHGSSNKAQVHPSIPCMSKTTKRADSDVTSPEDEEEDYNEDHDDMLEYDVVNLADIILNQKKQQHIPIVSFTTVEIREYDITIGECTVPTSGVPIGISSTYTSLPTQSIEEYESQHPTIVAFGSRRKERELLVPNIERYNRLNELGISSYIIREALFDCERINMDRGDSLRYYDPDNNNNNNNSSSTASAVWKRPLKSIKKIISFVVSNKTR